MQRDIAGQCIERAIERTQLKKSNRLVGCMSERTRGGSSLILPWAYTRRYLTRERDYASLVHYRDTFHNKSILNMFTCLHVSLHLRIVPTRHMHQAVAENGVLSVGASAHVLRVLLDSTGIHHRPLSLIRRPRTRPCYPLLGASQDDERTCSGFVVCQLLPS